jgi:hypothetical protein
MSADRPAVAPGGGPDGSEQDGQPSSKQLPMAVAESRKAIGTRAALSFSGEALVDMLARLERGGS